MAFAAQRLLVSLNCPLYTPSKYLTSLGLNTNSSSICWLSFLQLHIFTTENKFRNIISYYCQVTSVVSDSVRPHRWQPTWLPGPWDSPGKNIGVGCHFLLQCMKVKSESEVAQSCPTLRDPLDCSLPGSSIHGIFQAS